MANHGGSADISDAPRENLRDQALGAIVEQIIRTAGDRRWRPEHVVDGALRSSGQ
jgi:hypothetical protein